MHRRLLGPVVVALVSAAFAVACASTESDIPEGNDGKSGGETGSSTGTTLPPSNPPKGDSGTGSTSSSGGSTSSSGGAKTDSGASSSGSSGSSGGTAPACSFSGDFTKLIAKASEIQAGAPCDASCNPTTHCCLDLGLGGGGASGGLPLDAGAGGGGGLPTGGVCVSNN